MKHALPIRFAALLLAAVLPVLGGAAVPGRTRPGQLVVHDQTVELGVGNEPKLFTVACAAGEQLVGGGYALRGPGIRVAFSYPSAADGVPTPTGGQPAAWTVGAFNPSKTASAFEVSAACLADGDTSSSVASATETHAENSFSLATDCPDGTVRAGGGYSSDWDPRLGTAAISGSYPAPGRSWTVDVALLAGDPDVKARASVTVYAVCLSGGVDVADLAPTVLNLTAASPACTGADANFAAICSTAWTGSQRVSCPADQVLSGAGYQVNTGTLPGNYSVVVDLPSAEPLWTIGIIGSTPTAAPISLTITPLCVVAVVVPTATGGGSGIDQGGGPTAAHSGLTPLAVVGIAGGGLLVLLLVLLVTMALRRSAGRRSTRRQAGDPPATPAPQPVVASGLEVVLRAQRSSYPLDGFRETL